MPVEKSRAVIVVCGTVNAAAGHARHGGGIGGASRPVPVTWIANAERISGTAAAIGGARSGDDVVLQVPPAALMSRQRLRALVTRARESVPTLSAIAVRGGGAIAHRPLLVEEGIRVVLVDSLSADGRGSRRPAPAGWRCRNSAWGLWEIELSPPSRRSPLAFLGLAPRPRVRRGGLGVLVTDGLDTQGSIHHRLERLTAWADGLASRGAVEVVSLTSLVARLARDDQHSLAGSVLHAA